MSLAKLSRNFLPPGAGRKNFVVERVKELYVRPAQISLPVREVITVDGVRAVFEQGWGLIRASNTQPVLVMRFEAVDPASLQAIRTLMEEQVRTALAGLR